MSESHEPQQQQQRTSTFKIKQSPNKYASMNYPNFAPKYIAFDGVEGIGKTTAIESFAKHLRDDLKLSVFVTKEPGIQSSKASMALRNLMLNNDFANEITPLAREYISQAIRSMNLEKTVSEAIESGKYDVILQDRSLLSGLAYGDACGNPKEFLLSLKEATTSEFLSIYKDRYPQVYSKIYLFVCENEQDVSTFLSRAQKAKKEFQAGDYIESQGVDFMKKVSHKMVEYSTLFPVKNISVAIDESKDDVLTKLKQDFNKETLKQWFVSIDTEKLGPKYNQPLKAIGVFVGDNVGNMISYEGFYFKDVTSQDLKGLAFQGPVLVTEPDPACMKQFWSKFPHVLERIESKAKPLRSEMERFANFYEDLLKEAEKQQANVTLLCDNPGFDEGAINHHLLIFKLRNGYDLKSGSNYDENGGKDRAYYCSADPLPDVFNSDFRKRMKQVALSRMCFELSNELQHIDEFKEVHMPIRDAAENYYLFLCTRDAVRNLN